jgi:hypothetical protein
MCALKAGNYSTEFECLASITVSTPYREDGTPCRKDGTEILDRCPYGKEPALLTKLSITGRQGPDPNIFLFFLTLLI